MKKLVLVLICLLMTALIVQDVYEFVVTNRGLEFYAQNPVRIILIIALGIVGGLIALAFSKFKPRSQRTIKLSALAVIASVMSLYAIWMTYNFMTLIRLNFESGEIIRLALIPFVFIVIAGLLWFGFWIVERRKNPDSI